MFQKLPSLASLRAFEAAARHESFKLAATELCVTSAAVGGQVRDLESRLGCMLFARYHRRIELTQAGRTLQQACTNGFSALADGVAALQSPSTSPTLSIGAGSLFASTWLMQRLPRFWQRHPEVGLRVQHSPKQVNLEGGGLDAMIAWGDGTWKGVECDRVLSVELTPIATPALIDQYGVPATPADLLRLPLLFEYDEQDWREWFSAHGIARPALKQTTVIDDGVVAYRAALDGQGVLLAADVFVHSDLATGQLVRLFEVDVPTSRAYFLVTPTAEKRSGCVDDFRQWLVEEATNG